MDKQSKEMQELDVYLAENVKEWKFTKVHPDSTLIYIYEGEKKVVGNYIDWHPTSNIAQACECLDTFECWTLEKIGTSFVCHVFMSHKWIVETAETKELAICLVCRKAWEAK